MVTSSDLRTSGIMPVEWVKVVRQGTKLCGYYSKDGLNWMSTYSYDFPLGTSVYAGLAVCSRKDGTLCEATFDNVSMVPVFSGTYKFAN